MIVRLLRIGESDVIAEVDGIARASRLQEGFSVREELNKPWTRCWIAEEQARTMAFVVGWHVADELHILDIATHPEARGRGLATALMERCVEYAKAQGVRVLVLEVRRSNEEARRLYCKLGFTVLRVRSSYYGDTGEDALEMMLAVPMVASTPVLRV